MAVIESKNNRFNYWYENVVNCLHTVLLSRPSETPEITKKLG
jgi:hypothetical protein